jgi:hypothetical protein
MLRVKIMPTVNTPINLKELYEIDDYLWLEETIKLVREKRFEELDLENLLEELEDLSATQKRRVTSLLIQIIIHLLLYQYWESERPYNGNHWRGEIRCFRDQLNDGLSKTLKNLLADNLDSLYQRSLGITREKSGLKNLPQVNPYTLEQLLDIDWFPEVENN